MTAEIQHGPQVSGGTRDLLEERSNLGVHFVGLLGVEFVPATADDAPLCGRHARCKRAGGGQIRAVLRATQHKRRNVDACKMLANACNFSEYGECHRVRPRVRAARA